jgi:hypothetical protein
MHEGIVAEMVFVTENEGVINTGVRQMRFLRYRISHFHHYSINVAKSPLLQR